MTFLSVFQIVSNKSIPRKRPREVALSTFQTFGFPIPFPSSLVPPAFLISCDAGVKTSEWLGDGSSGPSLCSSPQSWKLPFPLLVSHKLLLGPTAWGGFQSIIRNPLQTDPSAPLPPKQPLGGELPLPSSCHLLSPPLPTPFLLAPWLLLVSLRKSTRCLVEICFPCWLVGWGRASIVGSVFELLWGPATLQTQLTGYPQETLALNLYALWAEMGSVVYGVYT